MQSFAHVVIPVSDWGNAPGPIRIEVIVNGVGVGGYDFYPGQTSQVEVDVPENGTIRLDAIVQMNAQTYYSSSPEYNVGSNPNPPPPDEPPVAPTMPTFGSPYTAYWYTA